MKTQGFSAMLRRQNLLHFLSHLHLLESMKELCEAGDIFLVQFHTDVMVALGHF